MTFFLTELFKIMHEMLEKGSERFCVAMEQQELNNTTNTFWYSKCSIVQIGSKSRTLLDFLCTVTGRALKPQSSKWNPTNMWLDVLFYSLSELYICCICSAVSADTSCLHLRSEVKLSAFMSYQEVRLYQPWCGRLCFKCQAKSDLV